MMTSATARARRASLAWSAGPRVARLLISGLLGWLSLLSRDVWAWRTVSLVVVPVLATLVGVTWYLSRARAERRWRAALDRYAEQEEAKRTHLRMGHRRCGRLT